MVLDGKRFAVVLLAAVTGWSAFTFHHHAVARAANKPLYWKDPMHSSYRSSKPGIAPDCGMQLVPVYAQDLISESAHHAAKGALYVDSATRQLYGIRLTKAETMAAPETVRVYGRVAADESRVYRVDLGVSGYVRETHGDAVGTRVRKNQKLGTAYSPEFLSAVGGYLSANDRTSSNTRDNAAPVQNAAGAQARADRLRNLGMSDAQIEEISVSRKIPEDVYILSPVNGVVISRSISAGQRFDKDMEMYRIANLDQVWVLAEVLDSDLSAFRAGTVVRLSLPDSREQLSGRVSDAVPEVDEATRAVRVRIEVKNPHGRLIPGMFLDVLADRPRQEGLTVPCDAVIDTGKHTYLYVEAGAEHFELREVKGGACTNDRVQIRSGVRQGEMVVSAGTFLLDSEYRLHASETSASGS